MTLYHGTSIAGALEIAKDGAILSPWEQDIKLFRIAFSNNKERFKRLHPGRNLDELEQLALESACETYADYEIEHRVKSVSMTSSLYDASHYALRFDNHFGGLVLGFGVDNRVEQILDKNWQKRSVIFIPRRFSLDMLQEVHLTPVAQRLSEAEIKESFERYHPKYFLLD